jgi:predicted DNA-binding protein (MmcQ/YjbR family)
LTTIVIRGGICSIHGWRRTGSGARTEDDVSVEHEGPSNPAIEAAYHQLREAAMAYPEATEDFPWGRAAWKVRKKAFFFAGKHGEHMNVSMKLPESSVMALSLPFAEPTGYGLGKSGWVSARIEAGTDSPVALLLEWMDESYRTIAPKKLSKLLADPV